jgi:hypothetical protein
MMAMVTGGVTVDFRNYLIDWARTFWRLRANILLSLKVPIHRCCHQPSGRILGHEIVGMCLCRLFVRVFGCYEKVVKDAHDRLFAGSQYIHLSKRTAQVLVSLLGSFTMCCRVFDFDSLP